MNAIVNLTLFYLPKHAIYQKHQTEIVNICSSKAIIPYQKLIGTHY